MLCVTGGERDAATLRRRIQAAPQLLHEVRLDLLEHVDDEALSLLASDHIVATCRSRAQGGGFGGDEAARLALLQRALARQPGYLDVEGELLAEVWQALSTARGDTRLIASFHRFQPTPPGELARLLAHAPPQAALLKLAVAVEDAADLLPLLDLAHDARPLIRIAMGPAGLLSRALYRRFGSPWTYVVPAGAAPLAPGQLDLEQARAWRLDRELTPLALVGGPQVLDSPGPRVYNALFHRRDLPFVYLPVVSRQAAEALALLERLGFAGISVTMPLKQSLAVLVDHDGPINTLVRTEPSERPGPGPVAAQLARRRSHTPETPGGTEPVDPPGRERVGKWTAHNTDVDALRVLLSPHVPPGSRALVLGAGGAARAAASMLKQLGCATAICSRDDAKAAAVAHELELATVVWAARGQHVFDLLVNATPLGSDGVSDPMPPDVVFDDRLVLDAVIGPTGSLGPTGGAGSTPLIRRARADGARTFEGIDWWLHQGSRQMTLITGEPISVEELTALASGGSAPTQLDAVPPVCARDASDPTQVEAVPPVCARDASDPMQVEAIPSVCARDASDPTQVEAVPPVCARDASDPTQVEAVPPVCARDSSHPVVIRVPGSKSVTQRALLLAALAPGTSWLRHSLDCDDSRVLRRILRSLGVAIAETPDGWRVEGGLSSGSAPRALDCGEAGSALRFTAPLSLLVDAPLTLDGSPRLRLRPLTPLLDALERLGVAATFVEAPGRLPVQLLRRAAPPDETWIDATHSSQFLSGLLMAAPCLPHGLRLQARSAPGEPMVSRPYVELTVQIMQRFGVTVDIRDDTYRVPSTPYRPCDFTVEGDWSGAAFLLAAAHLTGRAVQLLGLSDDSPQGDRVFVQFIDELRQPRPHRFDLAPCPDLIAPLAAAAVHSRHPVQIAGVAHARLKESDRIAVLARGLRQAGVRIEEQPDGLTILPGGALHPARLDPTDDHRMAMAFGLLSLLEPGVEVSDHDCVNKSFPAFWHELERLR